MEENKKQSSEGSDSKSSSSRSKIFGAGALELSVDDASRLIGGIVEKGISDNELQSKPIAPPKPSVLPFPAARHRSQGPHWGPIGGIIDDNDNDGEKEEDKGFMEFDPIAPFANPVERKKKKGLDLSRWREIASGDNRSIADKVAQKTEKERKSGAASKRNVSRGPPSAVPMKMDVKRNLDTGRRLNESGEAMTSISDDGSFSSATDMELDNLKESVKDANPVNFSVERRKHDGIGFSEVHRRQELSTMVSSSRSNNFKNEQESMSLDSQIDAKNRAQLQRMSPDEIAEAQAEIMEKIDPVILKALKKRSNNFKNEQESMSLESQIDAENRARLQGMSPDEIAEAQAEIMEKMDPAILKALKKRAQAKLKKQISSSSEVGTTVEQSAVQNENSQDAEGFAHLDHDISHMVATTSDNAQSRRDNGAANRSLWNAWSERVEAVRELRFSLEGAVVENDFVQVPNTCDISVQNRRSADNVTERDFLRTEGDPAAIGYTIKEAVALARSVVPGQRALALHLIYSVLDKALHGIYQNRVVSTLDNANKFDRYIDWESVWAFALGPEPELVLSLRMSLDDNH